MQKCFKARVVENLQKKIPRMFLSENGGRMESAMLLAMCADGQFREKGLDCGSCDGESGFECKAGVEARVEASGSREDAEAKA